MEERFALLHNKYLQLNYITLRHELHTVFG